MPLVSVIIPAYNRAPLLERAIDSVLCQTMRDHECIVVDDASTDGTGEILRARGLLARVKYVCLPLHKGVSAARNAGVAAAASAWLAFLDSDDQWNPLKLERQMLWHYNNPSYRISQTREIWVRRGRRVNPPATHEKKHGYIFKESLVRCMVTPSSMVMDTALFREAGGFDESLPACEDYDLWLRITCGHPVGLVDEYLLTRYGGHSDQLSATVPALDRFRIQSIENLLASGKLSAAQADLARTTLVTKARIMANGCKKRGNRADYERYSRIAGTLEPGS
jgi:glycosyltransferase involved in cell wall biosynthesis